MKNRYSLYLILIVLAILPLAGCVSQEAGSAPISIPKDNLPQGFKYMGELNDSVKYANMTEEISDFYGAEDIGKVQALKGHYWWGEPGVDYDSMITIIATEDANKANAAVKNYLSMEKFKTPPLEGVKRFGNITNINGNEATEIRTRISNTRGVSIRYNYLWTNDSIVVLVEGNGSKDITLELAKTVGI